MRLGRYLSAVVTYIGHVFIHWHKDTNSQSLNLFIQIDWLFLYSGVWGDVLNSENWSWMISWDELESSSYNNNIW